MAIEDLSSSANEKRNKKCHFFLRHLLRENILDAAVRIIVGTKFCILFSAPLCLRPFVCSCSSFPVCRLLPLCSFACNVTLISWVFLWSVCFGSLFVLAVPGLIQVLTNILFAFTSFCHVFGCSPCYSFSSLYSSLTSFNPLWSPSFLLSPP